MSTKYPNTFSEYSINTLKIKNRLSMAPMTSNYGDRDGNVTEKMVNYYAARARGGVGFIFVEACYVNKNGKGFIQQLGLDDDKYIPGLKGLVDSVHQGGAKVFLQLIHGGRQTFPAISGTQPIAPSPIPCPVVQEMPREMTVEEIKSLVDDFGKAATRAKEAGFDGVDIHCAHGYMVEQFLSPYSNCRSDEYGGDLKGRMRFLNEIVENIRHRVGPEYPIVVRLSAEEYVPNGLSIQDSIEVAKILEKAGVNALSISAGVYETVERLFPPMDVPQGSLVYLAEAIKKAVSIPVLTVGGLTEAAYIEQLIQEGKVDGAILGRALLADPEWPRKAFEGLEQQIIPCIGCNQCRNRAVRQEINCTVNHRTGREAETQVEYDSSLKDKLVMVIGGGPAGMQAAIIAKERGFTVELYEAADKLGGQVNLAIIPPKRERINDLISYLERGLTDLGITVFKGVKVDVETIAEKSPHIVICATGATPADLSIPGMNKPNVFNYVDALTHPEQLGKYVLVIGAGVIGCEVADYLLSRGHAVTVAELLPYMLTDTRVEGIVKNMLLKRLKKGSAPILLLTSTKVTEILDNAVLIEKNNVPKLLPNIDSVVVAVGSQSYNDLYSKLKGNNIEALTIGDAAIVGTVFEAIHSAWKAALELE